MRFDGNRRDRRIEIADDGVVVAPGVLHRVFDRGELRLQIPETTRRLKLRIGFDRNRQSAQCVREARFGLSAGRRSGALRSDGFRSGRSHRIECFLLVRGVTLHGGHEIGHQIGATLQLHVDVGPRVLGPHAKGDQAVVQRNNCEDDYYGNDEENDEYHRSGVRGDRKWRFNTARSMHQASSRRLSDPCRRATIDVRCSSLF